MTALPPLETLRAFEAAARCGSFQQAAEEIGLTPSAISHRIRALEHAVGQPLFVRQHRKVVLTAAGTALRDHVARGFRELERGVAAVTRSNDPHVLRVTAPPGFAAAFLTPAIDAFERAAGMEVHLLVGHSVMDFTADAIDVAIRFAIAPPPDLHSETLLPLCYAPACTPALALRLRSPADLADVGRIVVRGQSGLWRDWFAGAGVAAPSGRELHVEAVNLAVHSAMEGAGVALLPVGVIGRQIATGQLALPFAHRLASRDRYWLACRKRDAGSARIRLFTRWLRAQIAADAPEAA